MFSFSRTRVAALRSTVVFLFASVLTHAAVITLSPTVTSISGGMYKYAYSISYTGTNDAFLIDISVPKDPAAITNLTVPSGFTDQFDSVNGLVSFVENSSTFTATPTSGFFFDSPDAPGTEPFVASVYDSNFNISTITGSTIAPLVTPEPSSLYLLLFMAPACFFLNRRKAGKNSTVPETINPMETIHVSND